MTFGEGLFVMWMVEMLGIYCLYRVSNWVRI